MGGFLQSYGLWILLAAVLLAMHWFGTGWAGGLGPGRRPGDEPARPGPKAGKEAAPAGRGGH